MPGFTRKISRYNKNPSRRKVAGVGGETRLARRTPITILSIVRAASNLTVTFDQPIILSGIPDYDADTANPPLSASQTTPVIIVIEYDNPTTGVTVIVPFEDPAVRNRAAGYVSPGTFLAPE